MDSPIDTLFSEVDAKTRFAAAPLAVRMRPRALNEIVGQEEGIGKDTWLRRAIANDTLSSVILFGPAGTGKTSIAHVIANSTNAVFVEVSAVSGTVSDLRREIKAAEERLTMQQRRTILFIDEIHRFSRSQQDALLHAVEDRIVILVGATTENPFFEVNSALISRSRIVELKPISNHGIKLLVKRALEDERGLKGEYEISEDALNAIVITAGGDARMALTTLELAAALVKPGQEIGTDQVREASPHRQLPYDKDGDTHYDVISAFIKSMRGSDPDATVYWLARMIEGGEDPRFIARRIFILAGEDVGLADPRALTIAAAAFKSAQSIGYPECRIILAEAAIYMALAPKSNAAYLAIDAALKEVREGPARFVPSHLRDRHRPGSQDYGTYLYPHNYPGAWVDQQYLPDGLEKGSFYKPTQFGWEKLRFPPEE
jgi:putative ATPase